MTDQVIDVKKTIEEFEDYLAPRLDTYEHAIYLYIFRYTRLQGQASAVIGFKSARKHMASGSGRRGKPMSEDTCYDKLKSLERMGCIRILGVEKEGTRVELRLPEEIRGVLPGSSPNR